MTIGRQGVIDESQRKFSYEERRIAEFLASEDKPVKAQKETADKRSGDFE